MDNKLNEIHKNLILMKIKQPYHTVLNTMNNITYLKTCQQAPTVLELWIHVFIRII